jgi:hypothetical protein
MSYAELITCLTEIEAAAANYRRHPHFRDAATSLEQTLEATGEILKKPDGREPGVDHARGRILAKCQVISLALRVSSMRVIATQPSRADATILCQELIDLIRGLMPHLEARTSQTARPPRG